MQKKVKPAPGKPLELSRKTALENVLRSGAMMANLCFNLSQQKGKYQRSFKESYLSWDKAIQLYRERVSPAKGK